MTFTPTNNRQRYHDRRESWRLSNRKWAAANPEQKNASQRAYIATLHGFLTHARACRAVVLRQERARIVDKLAALEREEQECLMSLASATRTR